MKPRNGLGLLIALLLFVALVVGGGFWAFSSFKSSLEARLSVGCTAIVDGASHRLAVDQSENAALISALAIQRGMPARAASIALATGMQESKLRNIDYGDMDSVGLFQQRPSQDWGTVEQIMDPVYSANAFYDVLAQVPEYANLPINDAAQIVQRSGYPHAYAQHEPLSRAFASALTGQTPAAVSCTLPKVSATAIPDAVTASVQEALGPLGTVSATSADVEGGVALTLDVPAAHGWMVAQWVVAHANLLDVSEVSHEGMKWDRNNNSGGHNIGWQAVAARTGPPAPSELTVFLPAVPAAH